MLVPGTFVAAVVPIMLWVYTFIATVVLVNLLIAMMGSTYANYIEKAEEEYFFDRVATLMEYRTVAPVPPPFGLMLAPFALVVALGVANLALRCCRRRVAALRARITGAALGIFLISFIVVADTALSTWDCIGEGSGYVRAMPSTSCGAGALEAASVAALALLCVGTLALAAILWCRRQQLRDNESFMRA